MILMMLFTIMILFFIFSILIKLTKFVFGAAFGIIGGIITTVIFIALGVSVLFAALPLILIVLAVICCFKLIR